MARADAPAPAASSSAGAANRVVLAGLLLIIAVVLPVSFLYGASKQLVVAGPGYLNARGTAVGNDFLAFYSGGRVALAGDAAKAYDIEYLRTVQRQILGGGNQITPWAYPPTYFLLVAPFAALPYLVAVWIWIIGTLGALLLAGFKLAPTRWSLALIATFPAVLLNVQIGQNACLTAALIAGGLVLLSRRPVAAGVLFGIVFYKPHLGLVLPVCLLAARQYKAFGAMAATGVVLVAVSLAAFGVEPWWAFFRHLPVHYEFAWRGVIEWDGVSTALVAFLALGFGVAWAEALQALASVAAVLCAAFVWARTDDAGARSLALAAALLLATPFALTYDMAILAVPGAIYAKRWLDGDRSLRSLALPLLIWSAPLLSRPVYMAVGQQIGPLLHGLMLFASVAACRKAAPATAAWPFRLALPRREGSQTAA